MSIFDKPRTPKDYSEEELQQIQKYLKENNIKTVGELIADQNNNNLEYLIESRQIFKTKPIDFFEGMSDSSKLELHEKIRSIEVFSLIGDTSIPKEEKQQIIEWFKEYEVYLIRLKKTKQQFYINTTLDQQLLIVHFLEEANYLEFEEDLKHNYKRKSFVLAGLLNRAQPTFYDHLKKFHNTNYQYKYYKLDDLKEVKKIFEDAKMDDVIALIDKEIQKILQK